MVGTTLVEIRNRIQSLAAESGDYVLRCARTGDRPVPAAGERFPDRATAREAARATRQYRSTLRQYDPRVPYYDVVVCQDTGPMVSPRELCKPSAESDWTLTDPVIWGRTHDPESSHREERTGVPTDRGSEGQALDGAPGIGPEHSPSPTDDSGHSRALIECCHRVAAAVFEALCELGHDDIERAVMDAYVDHAETIERPDELCCCLLESMASELEAHLDTEAQRSLFDAAAARLEEPVPADDAPPTADPVEAGFAALSNCGVVGACRFPADASTPGTDAGTVEVECSSYALRASDGRLPVVPIVLVLSRHVPEWPPASVTVTSSGGHWRLQLDFSAEATRGSLASAPIETGS